jgi:hypothetical protein
MIRHKLTHRAAPYTMAAALLLTPIAGIASQPPVALEYPEHIPLGSTESKPVQIEVNVLKGFHLQANPASRENLIPTELIVEPSSLLQISTPSYPKGTPFRFSPIGNEILTYTGKFQIGLQISRLQPGSYKRQKPKPVTASMLVKGKLRYQACDEKTCLRPSALPFEFWVENP